MIKRKLWIIIGIMVLIVGGVVALTSFTSDTLKVEKVGDTYSVYVLKEQKTTTEIQDELDRLNIKKVYYSNEFYNDCIINCPLECEFRVEYECYNGFSKDWLYLCEVDCEYECKQGQSLNLLNINNRIEELNKILKTK